MFQNIMNAFTTTGDDDNGPGHRVKGTVVLMKKNVLDFNDFSASFLDRLHEFVGKRVSLQLVSSVNVDPGQFHFPPLPLNLQYNNVFNKKTKIWISSFFFLSSFVFKSYINSFYSKYFFFSSNPLIRSIEGIASLVLIAALLPSKHGFSNIVVFPNTFFFLKKKTVKL